MWESGLILGGKNVIGANCEVNDAGNQFLPDS